MIVKGNFKAHLELHSVNSVGDEVITFTHTHERSATHAEFMTHRVSRNASSTRAIPRKRMDSWIQRDPAMPLHLGSNKPGMQSDAEIEDVAGAEQEIRAFYQISRKFANRLHDHYGLHKEICNRFDEVFGWINTVSTWSRPAFMNYCALRMTPQAEPRIQRLAVNMAREYVASTPQKLEAGDWHIPFISDFYTMKDNGPINTKYVTWNDIKKLLVWSVARSAWTSYQTVEEKDATWELAVKRHDDCIDYKHVTTCEHQKRANADHGRNGGTTPGFDEYRHMIPGESVSEIDLVALLNGPYKDRDFIAG